MGKLDGKRALVTGAASGIGLAIARRFAAEGASVVAVDVNPAVREVAPGGRVADVTDEAQVAELCGDATVVCANAGILGTMAPLADVTLDDFRRVLEVNLLGAFLCVKHAARAMVPRGGGAIVCTASVAGLRSGAGPIPYSASKAAVINLVATAAWQLGGTGVRVNAICPGLFETGMTRFLFEGARAAGKDKLVGQLNPMRRAGALDEIAAAALFLASDEAGYVNGQALAVDGGFSASHPVMPGRFM